MTTNNEAPPSEALAPLQITLNPADAVRLLRKCDWPVNDLQLVTSVDDNSDDLAAMKLDVWMSGKSTCHQIILHHDGTWTAITHINA